jgi:uncharacterized protein involved in outer membrane biogenesis
MGKTLKVILGIVAALAVVLVLVMTLVVSNLDRLVKSVVEEVGSDVTGVPVRLSGVDISLQSGRGTLTGLSVGNPAGFKATNAFELDSISVALDIDSITGDVAILNEILIDGARVNFEQNRDGSNLQAIQDNIARQVTSGAGGDDDSIKLIVDLFRFTNGSIAAEIAGLGAPQEVAIPPVEVRDVGRKSSGATASEVAKALLEPVVRKALRAATGSLGDVALDAAKESAKEKAEEKLDEAKDKLKGLLGGKN